MIRNRTTHIMGYIVLLMVFYRILGIQGRDVLLGILLLGMAFILAGGLLLGHSIDAIRQGRARSVAAVLLLASMLLGFGGWTEVQAARDFWNGPATTHLTECSITRRMGAHGIVGLRYYLNGTDAQGKVYHFPLTFAAVNELEGKTSVTVVHYVYTGRIREYDTAERLLPRAGPGGQVQNMPIKTIPGTKVTEDQVRYRCSQEVGHGC